MLRIQGVSVGASDVYELIDRLRRVGRADDVTAAEALEDGMLNGATLAEQLSEAERDAILDVLDHPPRGLAQLRNALLIDHWEREV